MTKFVFLPGLCCINLQLKRARKLFAKYDVSLFEFAMLAGACLHESFVALVVVGHTSGHSLKEFKDSSGGHDCLEVKLLIRKEQMKAAVATELLQPCLFAVDRQQPPSPGCLCVFGGKVSLADVPAGVDVGVPHGTNGLQLEREARRQALKKKK